MKGMYMIKESEVDVKRESEIEREREGVRYRERYVDGKEDGVIYSILQFNKELMLVKV